MRRALVPNLAAALALLATAAAGAADAAPAAAPSARLLRDPFVRPLPPAPAAPEAPAEPAPLHLRAVILNGAHSIANIDGDIVAAGEHARDYAVLRIDARGVLVARAGTQQLLTISDKDKQ